MNYTKEQILEALRSVVHPEQKKDIVSLGMIDDISIEGKKIGFSLVFKKSNDPFTNSIRKACVQAILDNIDAEADIKGNITIKTMQTQTNNENELLPGVKNIIAVASGKGGVGKSTVAVNLAIALANKGLKVGLVDADIYGPSIPIMFGLMNDKPEGRDINGKVKVIPFEKFGIKLLSIGFFVEPEQALIWRGPMASNALKQLFSEADWGELDCMVVDMPPGTGDIHLTLVQSVAVTGAIVVSTPQAVALADAHKAVSMFNQQNINVPVLGFVENMAWFTPAELPNNKYFIFGNNGTQKLAESLNIPVLGQIPIVQSICESGDNGTPIITSDNSIVFDAFMNTADNVIKQLEYRNIHLTPTNKVQIDPNAEGCSH